MNEKSLERKSDPVQLYQIANSTCTPRFILYEVAVTSWHCLLNVLVKITFQIYYLYCAIYKMSALWGNSVVLST
jgi:hypothetical protein